MISLYEYVRCGFQNALSERGSGERRVGAELKFPLVNAEDGSAVPRETVDALWQYLAERGWTPEVDELNGKTVGARKPGEKNETVASCETGYCKTEFSLAHVGDLFALQRSIDALKDELRPFAERHGAAFLGYGIHPVTPPSKRLLMKKSRSGVWDKVFGSNRHIAPEDGDDFHLFTINAASHVHISVAMEEATDAVNVLNGFAGAQLALTAHSNVWRGELDPDHKCVAETLWNLWMPEGERVGVPVAPYADLRHYVDSVAQFRPVFVKRDGMPIVLENYKSFAEYYGSGRATGRDADGNEVSFETEPSDMDTHSTCYWHNARLSRYYTVENRTNDQQPPEELASIAAITLGLVSALPEAREAVAGMDWDVLRRSSVAACRGGLDAQTDGLRLSDWAGKMLALARKGLERRGLGEEAFLEPLERRLANGRCPADETKEMFLRDGVQGILEERRLR